MRMMAIDGWRAIAALLVAVYHLMAFNSVVYEPWLRQMAPILELFFIMSGFVMAMIYADRVNSEATFGQFVVRRLKRLYPPHLAMIAALVLLELVRLALTRAGLWNSGPEPFTANRSIDALLSNLSITQAWGEVKAFTWNYPSWTVSAELVAYLVMGMVSLFFLRTRTRLWVAALAVLVSGALFYRLTEGATIHDTISVARCVLGFFLGYLLHAAWKRWQVRGAVFATALEVLSVVGMFFCFVVRLEGPAYFLNHVIFGLLVFTYASGAGALSRVFGWGPLARLGERSYSVYMVHAVVLAYLDLALRALGKLTGRSFFTIGPPLPTGETVSLIDFGATWMNDLFSLFYLIVVIVAGSLLYRWVEAPSRAAASMTPTPTAKAGGSPVPAVGVQ